MNVFLSALLHPRPLIDEIGMFSYPAPRIDELGRENLYRSYFGTHLLQSPTSLTKTAIMFLWIMANTFSFYGVLRVQSNRSLLCLWLTVPTDRYLPSYRKRIQPSRATGVWYWSTLTDLRDKWIKDLEGLSEIFSLWHVGKERNHDDEIGTEFDDSS